MRQIALQTDVISNQNYICLPQKESVVIKRQSNGERPEADLDIAEPSGR
ncbi:17004_t:CDS:2 [Dentiscutata heterogama]|uniref:17004_t:CDS:1 n=1 Tax=Dentiscutata heterogama TaxID=1316150 RepID=A0ACA9K7H2_9GLOM|nr:17004_t:CDS:2 [Dentiscutata heterogama]